MSPRLHAIGAKTVDGVVATIDNPPMNLVNEPFYDDPIALLDASDADRDLKVIVSSSADPDYFLLRAMYRMLRTTQPPSPDPAGRVIVLGAHFSAASQTRGR